MCSHIADRAATPVDPSTPIKGVIDRMVRNTWAHTKKQVPGKRVRNGVAARHGRGQARIDAILVPFQAVQRLDGSLRPWNTLWPEANGPVGPNVNLTHLADRPCPDVLHCRTRIIERVPLIAHLRDYLRLFGATREPSSLINGPRERLLYIHRFAKIHAGQGDWRVHVVRSGDDDTIDVLLLLQHLAIVGITLRLGNQIILQMKNRF